MREAAWGNGSADKTDTAPQVDFTSPKNTSASTRPATRPDSPQPDQQVPETELHPTDMVIVASACCGMASCNSAPWSEAPRDANGSCRGRSSDAWQIARTLLGRRPNGPDHDQWHLFRSACWRR